MAGIPIAQSPVLEGSYFSRAWYLALQSLATPSYQKSAGISGVAALTVPNNTVVYYLNPTANVTALTLTFPASIADAQTLTIANISTTFTILGIVYPTTVIGGSASFTITGSGGFETFKFSATDKLWYRIG